MKQIAFMMMPDQDKRISMGVNAHDKINDGRTSS